MCEKKNPGEIYSEYPGRDVKMIWDAENMKVTYLDEVNYKRFVPAGETCNKSITSAIIN